MSNVNLLIYDGRKLVRRLDLSTDKDAEYLQHMYENRDAYPEYLLDTRSQFMASSIEYTWDYYCFYLDAIKTLEDTRVLGRFQQYLDLGYLPICAPPLFFKDCLHKAVRTPLMKAGLEFFNLSPTSICCVSVPTEWQDIWLSKFEAAKIVKDKPIHLITVRDVYEALNIPKGDLR